jgi:two-component system chemotaxis response regulator CheB
MNTQSVNSTKGIIRVLLVDDSALSLELVSRMLAAAPDIEVVGRAHDGAQALELIEQLHPDVICTDLHMPKMDGLALTRELMVRHPLPILVLSISVQAEQEHNIFSMLEAGALDVLAKPRGGPEANFGVIANDLITKIRILSGVKVIGRRKTAPGAATSTPAAPPVSLGVTAGALRIIGIGASTGGPQAFEGILRQLPANFALPLVCVQHIAQGFMQGLVDWLASSCKIRVCTAQEGAELCPGTAYFPPDDRHIEIDASGRFRCSSALAVSGHRPSVDIAFSSLARHYGAGAVGVLLTGMGKDGAQGLLDIRCAGGLTIAQDEASSVVFGMPGAAIELGAALHVLALDKIGPAMCALVAKLEKQQ